MGTAHSMMELTKRQNLKVPAGTRAIAIGVDRLHRYLIKLMFGTGDGRRRTPKGDFSRTANIDLSGLFNSLWKPCWVNPFKA